MKMMRRSNECYGNEGNVCFLKRNDEVRYVNEIYRLKVKIYKYKRLTIEQAG